MTKREDPRISVNKLSEYIITPSPQRRKTIIKLQKNPPECITPYYKFAEESVIEFLSANNSELAFIDSKIEQLEGKLISTSWEEKRNKICIDALIKFKEFNNNPSLQGLRFSRTEKETPKLKINNVSISVRPELYLLDQENNIKGCIKLVFAKTRPVSNTEAEYTSVCMQRWLHENRGINNSKNCLVLDVFSKVIFNTPKAYKKRMNDIESACQEISTFWNIY